MKAMLYRSYGGPEVLERAELPSPSPSEGQVLVRVRASSVNPIDWKQASGKLRLFMPVKFPMVPGYDVAGTVEAVGPGVQGFAVGDPVAARLGGRAGGASAELALAGLDVVAKLPPQVSFEQGAALPLAGMTAQQGLRLAGVERGFTGRVLVVGASGGVGHLGVQLAKLAGAHVVGVSSARNAELVKSLGADEVVDYAKDAPYAGQAPFDVIFDCVGARPGELLPLLAAGGRYATPIPAPSLLPRVALNALSSKKILPVMLKPNAADLAALLALAAQGALRAVVDATFPLEDLAKAWERSLSGRAVGKLVLAH